MQLSPVNAPTYLSPITCLPLPTTAGVKALGALHWLQTSHTECAIHPLSIKGHTVDVSCLIATSACCATLCMNEHRHAIEVTESHVVV